MDSYVYGAILTLLGIISALLFGLYWQRDPFIRVICRLLADETPSGIVCEIHNESSVEARDVIVGFNGFMPVETRLITETEIGASIREVDVLPDPNIYTADTASLMRSFSVHIPRVSRRSLVSFRLQTENDDNVRAAAHVIRIRKEIENVLTEFGNKLKKSHLKEASDLNTQELMNAKVKEECFYKPGSYSYSRGNFLIEFLSESEEFAESLHSDLYKKFKKDHLEVFQDRPRFLAPVLRIKTPQGKSTYAVMPPYISTSVLFEYAVSELEDARAKGEALKVPIPVPEDYNISLPEG